MRGSIFSILHKEPQFVAFHSCFSFCNLKNFLLHFYDLKKFPASFFMILKFPASVFTVSKIPCLSIYDLNNLLLNYFSCFSLSAGRWVWSLQVLGGASSISTQLEARQTDHAFRERVVGVARREVARQQMMLDQTKLSMEGVGLCCPIGGLCSPIH